MVKRFNSNRWTTKERTPHSEWLVLYALGTRVYDDPRPLLRQVQKYRRALKREPFARQTEIEFPLPKSK